MPSNKICPEAIIYLHNVKNVLYMCDQNYEVGYISQLVLKMLYCSSITSRALNVFRKL